MQTELAETPTLPPLRAIRHARGLSLRKVAERAEIDVGHLSRVERGSAGLSVAALARLARVLGLHEFAQMLEPYTTAPTATAARISSRSDSSSRCETRAR